MFEIVRQSRGIGRVLLTSRSDGDLSYYAWLVFVYRHVNLKAIVQSVDFSAQRIAFYGFISVLAFGFLFTFLRTSKKENSRKNEKQFVQISHCSTLFFVSGFNARS